jgi:hypothetical protein
MNEERWWVSASIFHKIKNWHTFGKEEAWQLALE